MDNFAHKLYMYLVLEPLIYYTYFLVLKMIVLLHIISMCDYNSTLLSMST